jgi:hypothetical protein
MLKHCTVKSLLLQYHLHGTSWCVTEIQWVMILPDPRKSFQYQIEVNVYQNEF